FLTSGTATTDGNGLANFAVNVLPAIPLNQFITATATDADGNTSEFSACVSPRLRVADLAITKTATTQLPGPGDDLSYLLKVDNAGPDAAADVVMADTVPANTTFKSLTSPQGWACTRPQVGSGGSISCSVSSLAAGASATFTLVVTVNTNVPRDTLITNTASVTSSTFDSDKTHDTATAITRTGAPNPQVVAGSTVEIGPIAVLREPSPNPASGTFVIGNTGNATLYLIPTSLLRVAPNVDRLTRPPDDRSLFDVKY